MITNGSEPPIETLLIKLCRAVKDEYGVSEGSDEVKPALMLSIGGHVPFGRITQLSLTLMFVIVSLEDVILTS